MSEYDVYPPEHRRAFDYGPDECAYCGRSLVGADAPKHDYRESGRGFCNDLECYIWKHDGPLTPEQRAANDADVAAENERAENARQKARERDAREQELIRQLRTL